MWKFKAGEVVTGTVGGSKSEHFIHEPEMCNTCPTKT